MLASDPLGLSPAQWEQVQAAVAGLVVFAALAVTAALSFLLRRAIMPSCAATGELGEGALRLTSRSLGALSLLSLLLAAGAFIWSIGQAARVLEAIYPRFLI